MRNPLSVKIGVVIPARWGSKRLEGKPLKKIGQKSMLQRVVERAQNGVEEERAQNGIKSDPVPIIVATDDQRIYDHAASLGIRVVMTDPSCPSGTDRVYQAAQQLDTPLDFVMNLQGDIPFTPSSLIAKMIKTIRSNPDLEMVTPVVRLSWTELDAFRHHKEISSSSGTTVVVDRNGYAFWFSKAILPYLRNERELRLKDPISPVYRHIGIYGYSVPLLKKYVSWEEGYYEKLEGLEQLRALENGVRIQVFPFEYQGEWVLGGIDTEEDLRKAQYVE